MTQINNTFIAATIGYKIEQAFAQLNILLNKEDNEGLKQLSLKLDAELKHYQKEGAISVALIGQYSAGKSTIISALTGDRNIKIDADIATDRTTSYTWNGIKIIDTPGLFTEHKDHDEITYDAINKADLLVFCLTYMLFDSVTVENFKKLAYEQGYRWKMMLLVNKMSDEAGEDEEKIVNYRHSLAAALKPYNISDLPVCFIDAKDYCEGIDAEDDFLIEVSRFTTLVEILNNFVEERSSLVRFDTPVRIGLSYIDEAQLSFIRSKNEDTAFFEILNQISRKIRIERERLRTNIQSITLQISSLIVSDGRDLALALENKDEFENLSKQVEENLKRYYEDAESKINTAFQVAEDSLYQEIKEIKEGDLVKAFKIRLETNQKVSAKPFDSNVDVEQIKRQSDFLENIGKQAGQGFRRLATDGTNTANQGFLTASNVAGSNLHQAVYGVGKFLGVDFKPWQAVNLAKNLTNVMTVVGPILGIAAIAMDVHAKEKENEREQQLADARRTITCDFVKMAKDLEAQIEKQLQQFENQVYGLQDRQIAETRLQKETEIAMSDNWMKQLIEIRQDFESILQEITKASRV